MSNYEDKAEVTRNFYRKQGAEAERERIIQLLGDGNMQPSDWFEMRYDHLIALIKGEQK